MRQTAVTDISSIFLKISGCNDRVFLHDASVIHLPRDVTHL